VKPPITLPGFGSGTTHALTLLTFGDPGARPHVHVQGGLHADEGPGMLAARMLADRLGRRRREGRLRGCVTVLPAANPIGLGQFVLGDHAGRFDLYDGRNFNRDYPDLRRRWPGGSGRARRDARPRTCALIRAALAEALEARTAAARRCAAARAAAARRSPRTWCSTCTATARPRCTSTPIPPRSTGSCRWRRSPAAGRCWWPRCRAATPSTRR
jgi:hypothetical protein